MSHLIDLDWAVRGPHAWYEDSDRRSVLACSGQRRHSPRANRSGTVACESADALGKRYEPPSAGADAGEKSRFENVDIDKRKISGYVMNAEHPHGKHKVRVVNSATGLTAEDADEIETQIRAGVKNGTPVAGKTISTAGAGAPTPQWPGRPGQ